MRRKSLAAEGETGMDCHNRLAVAAEVQAEEVTLVAGLSRHVAGLDLLGISNLNH